MTKKLDASISHQNATSSAPPDVLASEFERRKKLGAYFREARLNAGLTESAVVSGVEIESEALLLSYESGRLAMPLEDVYALTNFLNIAPEVIMALIHELYSPENL